MTHQLFQAGVVMCVKQNWQGRTIKRLVLLFWLLLMSSVAMERRRLILSHYTLFLYIRSYLWKFILLIVYKSTGRRMVKRFQRQGSDEAQDTTSQDIWVRESVPTQCRELANTDQTTISFGSSGTNNAYWKRTQHDSESCFLHTHTDHSRRSISCCKNELYCS